MRGSKNWMMFQIRGIKIQIQTIPQSLGDKQRTVEVERKLLSEEIIGECTAEQFGTTLLPTIIDFFTVCNTLNQHSTMNIPQIQQGGFTQHHDKFNLHSKFDFNHPRIMRPQPTKNFAGCNRCFINKMMVI